MASSAIPNALERRHLIERELAPAKALAVAEAYLGEGRVLEALDFLRRGEADERLTELRGTAIESGDAFLLRAVATAQGRPAEAAEWGSLAEAAERLGKERYAHDARRQAEREED